MHEDLSKVQLPEWIDLPSIKKIGNAVDKPRANYSAFTVRNEAVLISKFLVETASSYDREKRCLVALKEKYAPRLIFFDDKNCILIREYLHGTPLLSVAAPPLQLIEQCFKAYAETTNLVCTKKLNHLDLINRLDFRVLAKLSSSERRLLPQMLRLLASGRQVPCHRDFKPQNIIVSQQGSPVIIDFEHYHQDSLAIDVARFCLGSSFSPPIPNRVDLIARFCRCLEEAIGVTLQPAELVAGAYCWAVNRMNLAFKERTHRDQESAAAEPLEAVRNLICQIGWPHFSEAS